MSIDMLIPPQSTHNRLNWSTLEEDECFLYPPQGTEDGLDTRSFEAIVREVCALLKRNVREFRDTLFRLEELSKKSWEESQAQQLAAMRCWTKTATTSGSVAISVLKTVPHLHPECLSAGLQFLSNTGYVPDILGRFGNDLNKFSKAALGVVGGIEAAYSGLEGLNRTRLEANTSEYSSTSQMQQKAHQDNATYRQEHDRHIQNMIDTVSELQIAILKTVQALSR